MLVITLPHQHLINGGVLYSTALNMNLLGFEPIATNNEGECILIQKVAFKSAPSEIITSGDSDLISKYPHSINNFIYSNLLTVNNNTNLLKTIIALNGEVKGITFYGKAPIEYKTRSIPVGYPNSSYINSEGLEVQYTYEEYPFTTGTLSFTETDTYFFFPITKGNGLGAAFGSEVLILESDGVEILSRQDYLNAVNITEND